MVITGGAKTTHVNNEWLRTMLASEPDPTALAAEYLKILYSAHDSTLPTPQHHTRYLNAGPVRGWIGHWTAGTQFSYLVAVWILLWSVMSVWCVLKARLKWQNKTVVNNRL